MINSINKYKGFYIGRYETGDEYAHSASKKSFTSPRIVKYNKNINNVTWYNSYDGLKRLSRKTEKYVETGMLYDVMWDYTLKWINETDTRSYEEISKDSVTWGNFSSNSLEYKESADGIEKTKDSYMMTPTGGITKIIFKGEIYSNSPTSSNNIFDMAGNVAEWTMALFNEERVGRGGIYDSVSSSPAKDDTSYYPYSSFSERGTRARLFIL